MVAVFDFPIDIQQIIMSKLPVKTLIRFTCVSKTWHSTIIADPHFAMSQFRLASQQKSLNTRLLMSTNPHYRAYPCGNIWVSSSFDCFEGLDLSLDSNSSAKVLTLPSKLVDTNIVVLASSNGLVLLGESEGLGILTLFSLWNPTTRFFYNIPSTESSSRCSDVSVGFGHLTATNEYKLVLFEHGCFAVHIFSTKDKSWKHISGLTADPNNPMNPFPCRGYAGESHLFSNGACHWVRFGDAQERVVYAFDFAEEKFRKIPLPNVLMMHGDRVRLFTLAHIRGLLCVSASNENGDVEVWEMKEYGVHESWGKLIQIRMHDLPDVFLSSFCWCPIFVTEGGSVVISLWKTKELVRIECHKEERPFCSGRYNIDGPYERRFLLSTVLYDETLVSV